MHFDVAVVGLGLIGSAAVRRLSQRDVAVVGIGPPEPDDWSTHAGPFASHYDSGRVTRRLDARFEWAELASRSIAEYPLLEERSGRRFHHPVGFVFVRSDHAGIEKQQDVISRLNLPVTIGTTDHLESRYAFPPGMTTLSEPGPAGFIDPRAMLAAQLDLAVQASAQVRRTCATSLHRSTEGFTIECADRTQAQASRVLVATGPYLNNLMPSRLAAQVMPEVVVMGRVSSEQAAGLSRLPSMIYLPDNDNYQDVYVVPPTRYPDGHWYVKIGGSIVGAAPLGSPEDMKTWMAGTAATEQLDRLHTKLEALLPTVEFASFAAKPCMITDTVHGLPYIDEIEDGLFVAVGGNGHAAKSSDALGALAADLVITGEWRDEVLQRAAFRAVFGDYEPKPGGRHSN